MSGWASPQEDGVVLPLICEASRTTVGGFSFSLVLITNVFGARDWLVHTAVSQAQHEAEAEERAVFNQFHTAFPVSVTPPNDHQSRRAAHRRHR
jgi:hypothetical protein